MEQQELLNYIAKLEKENARLSKDGDGILTELKLSNNKKLLQLR